MDSNLLRAIYMFKIFAHSCHLVIYIRSLSHDHYKVMLSCIITLFFFSSLFLHFLRKVTRDVTINISAVQSYHANSGGRTHHCLPYSLMSYIDHCVSSPTHPPKIMLDSSLSHSPLLFSFMTRDNLLSILNELLRSKHILQYFSANN